MYLFPGCGLPPGPGGLLGAAEGISYLSCLGIAAWSLFNRITSRKDPAGERSAPRTWISIADDCLSNAGTTDRNASQLRQDNVQCGQQPCCDSAARSGRYSLPEMCARGVHGRLTAIHSPPAIICRRCVTCARTVASGGGAQLCSHCGGCRNSDLTGKLPAHSVVQ